MSGTAHIVKGSSLTLDRNGVSVTFPIQLEGITGDADLKTFNALSDSSVPNRGDPHEKIPGLFVDTVHIRAQSPSQFFATVRYVSSEVFDGGVEIPDESAVPTLEVGTTVTQTTTERDRNGAPIEVFVNRMVNNEPVPDHQGGTVAWSQPQTVVRFRRAEPGSPGGKARFYVGTVNNASVFGDPRWFWLCTRIDGTTVNKGLSYEVVYEFQRNEGSEFDPEQPGVRSGWQPLVIYTDPKTGKPIPNPRFGQSLQLVALYRERAFPALNLTFDA